jgi:UDP-3-O-acyl-N-acetylglucosamine deacetylase
MLDAIGDLALAGAPILGLFCSHCVGHWLNVAALKALFCDSFAFEQIKAAQAGQLVPKHAPHFPAYVRAKRREPCWSATEMPRIEP